MEKVEAANADSLSTVRCVPAHTAPVTLIAVSTVAGCIAVLAAAILAAAWLVTHKHSLGPPGAPTQSPKP